MCELIYYYAFLEFPPREKCIENHHILVDEIINKGIYSANETLVSTAAQDWKRCKQQRLHIQYLSNN